MGTNRSLPAGWTASGAGPWRVHRRWVSSLGRETIGRRIRRRVLGAAAPGMDPTEMSFSLDDIVLSLIGWVIKIVLVVLVVPIVLVFVWVWGLFEVLVRLIARRPWFVDAYGRDDTQLRWKQPGPIAARRGRDNIREALARGQVLDGAEVRAARHV